MCHTPWMTLPYLFGSMVSNAIETDDAADEARDQARDLKARGTRDAQLVRQENARVRARHRVATAKAGITDSGSPTDTLMDLAATGERDARWAQLGYDQAARDKRREARRIQRKGLLDHLGSASSIGNEIIKLEDIYSNKN